MSRDNPRYVFMLVLMTAAAILSVAVRHGKAVPLRRSLEEFPFQIGEWKGVDQGRFPDEVMKVLQASDYTSRRYKRKDGAVVDLYIGYYQQQRAGESMHSPKNCLPSSGYEVLNAERAMLDIPQVNKKIEVNHFVVESDTNRQFVLYWYDAHGRDFASEYEGKAILVWEGLKTGRTDGALIRVMAPILNSTTEADEVSTSFARQIYPLLKDYLPE
jgi:EpsI family protein